MIGQRQSSCTVARVLILTRQNLFGDCGAELPAILTDDNERHQARTDMERKRTTKRARVLNNDATVAHLDNA